MRVLLLAVALLAVGVPPAAAALDPAKDNRTPGCKVRGSVTLAKFGHSRVFKDRRGSESLVYGCLYRRGISLYMTAELDRLDLALTRSAGPLVAFPQEGPDLTVFDLRDGGFADFYAGTITDVALRADGTLGWIAAVRGDDYEVRAGRYPPPYETDVEDTPPLLARGPAIGPTSLVFHRPGIYWTDAGTTRGAGYPGR